MKKPVAVCVILLLNLLVFAGCQSELDAKNISAYAEEQITISGLLDEDFTITVNDLAALETVSRKTSAKRANGETVSINAVGPLLDTLLAQYGYSQTDFSRIRFTASDKYSIVFSENILQNREIVLAVADGSSALSADDLPVRVVVPGERAMYWVRKLSSISFESDNSGAAVVGCEKIVMLETAAANLPAQQYDYYGSLDQTVAVSDLFNTYASSNEAASVYLLASDGLLN